MVGASYQGHSKTWKPFNTCTVSQVSRLRVRDCAGWGWDIPTARIFDVTTAPPPGTSFTKPRNQPRNLDQKLEQFHMDSSPITWPWSHWCHPQQAATDISSTPSWHSAKRPFRLVGGASKNDQAKRTPQLLLLLKVTMATCDSSPLPAEFHQSLLPTWLLTLLHSIGEIRPPAVRSQDDSWMVRGCWVKPVDDGTHGLCLAILANTMTSHQQTMVNHVQSTLDDIQLVITLI